MYLYSFEDSLQNKIAIFLSDFKQLTISYDNKKYISLSIRLFCELFGSFQETDAENEQRITKLLEDKNELERKLVGVEVIIKTQIKKVIANIVFGQCSAITAFRYYFIIIIVL